MEFFAAANSRLGFLSIFDEVFKDIQRLYILKGSSGCGKSTFMKHIAGIASEKGLAYHIIRCSADPNSLDGVIIPALSCAIADGTAPHLMDVKYPCVRETIINLGQFWDESELLPYRAEIISLTDLKGCHYKNAYRALSAAGTVDSLFEEIFKDCIDLNKIDHFAFKFADKLFVSKGNQKKVFATAFTSEGEKTATLCRKVKNLYTVNGRAHRFFMSALCRIAIEKGYESLIGCNWIDPKYTDYIYIPESETLITSLSEIPCDLYDKKRIVSTSRFVRDSKLNSVKARLRGLTKLKKELLDEAQTELFNAKEVHDEIEEIYIPAMNFDALDQFKKGFVNKLFGE